MVARGAVALLTILACAEGGSARPFMTSRHHAAGRNVAAFRPVADSAAPAGSGLDGIYWSLPAPSAPATSRRWMLGATNGAYTPPPPDAIHFDAGGARFKLRGAGLKMKMPIG